MENSSLDQDVKEANVLILYKLLAADLAKSDNVEIEWKLAENALFKWTKVGELKAEIWWAGVCKVVRTELTS